MDIKYGYIAGEERFFFIMGILDLYDREIVDYHTGLTCTGADAAFIMARGWSKRNPAADLIVRTDNGPQFIAKDFKGFIRVVGMSHVRISPYYPQSNGKIERWPYAEERMYAPWGASIT